MPEAGQRVRPAWLWLDHWFWTSMDWLYPPSCGGCQLPGQRWCPACEQSVVLTGDQVCPVCGRAGAGGQICPACQASPPDYAALGSWAYFTGPLREAIHRLKYNHDLGLGDVFTRYLIDTLAGKNWPIDLVVPVPLSKNRQAERGYNQAALLAKPLALYFRLKYATASLRRTKDTPSQVGLNAAQRKANVAGAFWAEASRVKGLNVLVVDDVATTGATLEACAQALLTAGAKNVWGLTLARAMSQV